MSSYVHIDNKNEDSLILGKAPRQGLDNTTLTAEAENILIIFQGHKKYFV